MDITDVDRTTQCANAIGDALLQTLQQSERGLAAKYGLDVESVNEAICLGVTGLAVDLHLVGLDWLPADVRTGLRVVTSTWLAATRQFLASASPSNEA